MACRSRKVFCSVGASEPAKPIGSLKWKTERILLWIHMNKRMNEVRPHRAFTMATNSLKEVCSLSKKNNFLCWTVYFAHEYVQSLKTICCWTIQLANDSCSVWHSWGRIKRKEKGKEGEHYCRTVFDIIRFRHRFWCYSIIKDFLETGFPLHFISKPFSLLGKCLISNQETIGW